MDMDVEAVLTYQEENVVLQTAMPPMDIWVVGVIYCATCLETAVQILGKMDVTVC